MTGRHRSPCKRCIYEIKSFRHLPHLPHGFISSTVSAAYTFLISLRMPMPIRNARQPLSRNRRTLLSGSQDSFASSSSSLSPALSLIEFLEPPCCSCAISFTTVSDGRRSPLPWLIVCNVLISPDFHH